MDLHCLGLNHTTAPVDVRERFTVGKPKLGDVASSITSLPDISGCVVISTCNRTEYYFATGAPEHSFPLLENHIACQAGLPLADASPHFYRKSRIDAASHLCQVVCGLDSMLLGETEIFGQVKQAYQAALDAGSSCGILNRVFQQAFRIGKKVRTETPIQSGATSVGNVAVELAEKIFGHLQNSEIMILGAGEMSRITAQSLVSRGARSIFVTNRSYDRAVELAREMGGSALRFDDWLPALSRVDVVIASTGAPHAIILPEHIESVRRQRKYRPLFLIDIAVPRDIDPAVGSINEVYLYDIDALEQIASQARNLRRRHIAQCEEIIDSELAKTPLQGT